MTHDQLRIAAYRNRAEALRTKADLMGTVSARYWLQSVAADYDRMANEEETRSSPEDGVVSTARGAPA